MFLAGLDQLQVFVLLHYGFIDLEFCDYVDGDALATLSDDRFCA